MSLFFNTNNVQIIQIKTDNNVTPNPPQKIERTNQIISSVIQTIQAAGNHFLIFNDPLDIIIAKAAHIKDRKKQPRLNPNKQASAVMSNRIHQMIQIIHNTLHMISKFFLTHLFAFSMKDKFNISLIQEALITLSTNHNCHTNFSTSLSAFPSNFSSFFSTSAAFSSKLKSLVAFSFLTSFLTSFFGAVRTVFFSAVFFVGII